MFRISGGNGVGRGMIACSVIACIAGTARAQSLRVVEPGGTGVTLSIGWDAFNGGGAVGQFSPSGLGFISTPSGTSMISIPAGMSYALARGANADGSVIAGTTGTNGTAFRWTQSTGRVSIGVLPLAGHTRSDAWRISSDGSTIVGESGPNSGNAIAFRHTSGGMQSLGTISGQTSSTARAVNADGSVVVGTSGSLAFRWTSSGGMQSLGTFAGASSFRASAVDAAGDVVLGDLTMGSNTRAFKWTSAGGITLLPASSASATSSAVRDVSDDGSVSLGSETIGSSTRAVAWYGSTVYDLNAWLPTQGFDLDGWTLNTAIGVSADGKTMALTGQKAGVGRALVVEFPIPLPLLIPAPGGAIALLGTGLFAIRRRR